MLRAPFILAALAAAAPWTLAGCGQVKLLPDLAPYLGGPWQAFEKAHPNSCGEPFTDKDGQRHVACATDAYTVLFDIDAAGNIRAYQGTPRAAS
jgi:hypothetical protein